MSSLVLCATDGGGARNIAALDEAVLRSGVQATVITSASCRHLLGDARWARDILLDPDAGQVTRVLDGVRPAAVICGTTRYASVDRDLVRLASALTVRSLSVVDERFGYRQRFLEDDGSLSLPDVVALMDAAAVEEAISEGLPAERCHATGSPALARLAHVAERYADAPPPRPACLDGLPRWPVLTFLSETHERDYGSRPGDVGEMGPFLGYTERTVFASVVRALERSGRPAVLVEKMHPASAPADAAPAVEREGLCHVRVRETDLWPILWHSTAVVGMRSMGLTEARFLGVPAISYQPGLIGPQRCSAVRLGLTDVLSDEPGLAAWWAVTSSARRAHETSAGPYVFAPPAAAERILGLALDRRVPAPV